jgi:Holliday junction resolvase RusA-like endonuclease
LEISFHLDMPPSVNALYIKRKGGGVALSAAANRYREHVKKMLAKRMVDLSVFPAKDHEVPYRVEVECRMANLENPGWFERFTKDSFYTKDSKDGKHKKGDLKHKKGDRKAKTRYKVVDVDNRIKFVQDCVIQGIGIPGDEQVFENVARKVCWRTGKEHVVVKVSVEQKSKFFLGEK